MACPFFRPTKPAADWEPAPRVPLGAPYYGWCAAGETLHAPDAHRIREVCNFGYARTRCPWFPETMKVDAYRYTLRKTANGEWRVIWVAESQYAPAAFGELRLGSGAEVLANGAPEPVQWQARAFVEAEWRKRGNASNSI
jgi:hypothetical protein